MDQEPVVISENSTFIQLELNGQEDLQLSYDDLLYTNLHLLSELEQPFLELSFPKIRVRLHGSKIVPLLDRIKERSLWIIRELPDGEAVGADRLPVIRKIETERKS